MKTATKSRVVFLATVGVLTSLACSGALAQVSDSAVSAVAGSAQRVVAASSSGLPAPLLPPVGAEEPSGSSSVALPSMPAAPSMTPPSSLSAHARSPSLRDKAEKVPDSVKSVVKRLNTSVNDVTLDDLNAAREAVARLDILIDIEKRLNDLATLRQERDEKGGGPSLANAIPASALGGKGMPFAASSHGPKIAGMPLSLASPLPPTGGMPSPLNLQSLSSSGSSVDLVRVIGAAGHYTATIKTTDGKTKQYHVGDKLSDGSVIRSISSHGLSLEKNKKTRIVAVKDVGTIFTGS